ncbi:hypothetical protein TNCT_517691 [Trichonephila clavata]|uniref:Uncharacterized protein n=1 Tax=Trichonephila clavata TaxID=2740835 RepID=A0A8X6GZC1_TRICU|nr:hypothetical protein TNCT_517691 [Trichonephila clavata]
MEMDDKDIVRPQRKMEGDKLQKSSPEEGKTESQTETNSEVEGDAVSNPGSSAKVSSVKGGRRITYEEKGKVLELLDKVSATLRNTSCTFLEELSKTKDESIKSPRTTDFDEEKINKDLDEFLKWSEESSKCLKKFKAEETGSKSPSSSSEFDLGKDLEECMKKLDSYKIEEDCIKKLDLDESPSVLGEVDEFMRKVGRILKIDDCMDDPERSTESVQDETASEAKGEIPSIEDLDSSEQTPVDLVEDLQNVSILEKQRRTLLKEIDRTLTLETVKLAQFVDSLEDSIKIGSKGAI